MALKKGDKVKQILPAPITGTVTGFALDQETGEVHAKVEWTEGEDVHSRHFKQDDLEIVE